MVVPYIAGGPAILLYKPTIAGSKKVDKIIAVVRIVVAVSGEPQYFIFELVRKVF